MIHHVNVKLSRVNADDVMSKSFNNNLKDISTPYLVLVRLQRYRGFGFVPLERPRLSVPYHGTIGMCRTKASLRSSEGRGPFGPTVWLVVRLCCFRTLRLEEFGIVQA